MQVRTRGFLIGWLPVALWLVVGQGCQTRAEPNVLLISLDACRADHLSAYGYARPTSPFMDRIAADGILFTHAFVNTPGTPPSHTTMLTSLYQETHRVYYDRKGRQPPTDPVPKNAVMLQEILRREGYATLAVTDGGHMVRQNGFDRGFDEYRDDGDGVVSGSRKMIGLIREASETDRPIFAFYHTYEIHSPYFPPREFLELFGHFESDFVPSNKNLLQVYRTARRDLSPEDLDFLRASYDAGIRFTDESLRRMFDELEALGFFDNYLLVITSDHGEEFADHGGLLHRNTLYDELLHVPLIISGTDLPKGKVDKRMASSVDIAPTILRYLGLEREPAMEGHSLLDSPTPERDAVFSQYGNLRYSLRTRDWKLIETTKHGRIELYDLQRDPGEQANVAEQQPERVSAMRNRLLEWIRTRPVLATEEEEKIELTQEQIEQLEALGYVARGDDSKN